MLISILENTEFASALRREYLTCHFVASGRPKKSPPRNDNSLRGERSCKETSEDKINATLRKELLHSSFFLPYVFKMAVLLWECACLVQGVK